MLKRYFGLGLSTLVVLHFEVTGASAATFMPLGDLAGGDFSSTVADVSADGSTVVGRSSGASGMEAFRWDATNGMVGLGDLAGGPFQSVAYGVSADGATVVGQSTSASSPYEAFIWNATDGMVGLGDLPGGVFSSFGFAVSGDGSTVVGRSDSASGGEAFIWDASNGMVGLGDLAGFNFASTSFDVSADGSIVVGAARSASGDPVEAFIWNATDGMVGLGDLPGGIFYSEAHAVSADGSIVVGSGNSSGDGDGCCYEAFIWDATNGMVGLGDLPGGRFFSTGLGVSDDGSTVVGYSGASGTDSLGDIAFIWNAIDGMQPLDAVLAAGGVDLTGWTLKTANGISADGLTIVGTGINPNGFAEAWIATIPEPNTALLVGLGLLVMVVRTRRRV